jgi:hypothetical protein
MATKPNFDKMKMKNFSDLRVASEYTEEVIFLGQKVFWDRAYHMTDVGHTNIILSKMFLFQLDTFIRNDMVDPRTVMDNIVEDFGIKWDKYLEGKVRDAIDNWVKAHVKYAQIVDKPSESKI